MFIYIYIYIYITHRKIASTSLNLVTVCISAPRDRREGRWRSEGAGRKVFRKVVRNGVREGVRKVVRKGVRNGVRSVVRKRCS